ncbi:MAG: arylsulfatase [Verrucomicrobiota bacterium]
MKQLKNIRNSLLRSLSLSSFLLMTLMSGSLAASGKQPNVIIVITDDQGYGDLNFTGNKAIQTPALNKLRSESTFLNDFHADPTCAPTRAALMTGRYSGRVGVWHTIQGRNMLRQREVTMADIFGKNGYATGLFGKWHLGDAYPYRPEDRGFQSYVYHYAGGVGQTPDYWGNDYFDDTYMANGKLRRFKGYCTDVWFDEGMKFIKTTKEKGQPFFAYISTNAPHSPYYVPLEYENKYQGKEDVPLAAFYGMITNIDDNMAKLMRFLQEEKLADNTILIFMTDNGSSIGKKGKKGNQGYNGGMRGKKASEYDGGHRVPFMIRWPGGNIVAGKSVERLTAHLDILPTLIQLCGLEAPAIAFDGTDISELLYKDGKDWSNRTLVVESQRVVDPIKWRKTSVMTDRWRLINGKELYDIEADPGQKNNLAQQYPEVLERLAAEYDKFWDDVSAEHHLNSFVIVGSDHVPIVTLTSHDWMKGGMPAWHQKYVENNKMAFESFWNLEVEQTGEYEISLRRWPVEADKAINDGTFGEATNYKKARLRIGEMEETKDIPAGAKEITFKVYLEKGNIELAPVFFGSQEKATPFYAYITHQPKPGWQTLEGIGLPRYDPNYGRKQPQKKW